MKLEHEVPLSELPPRTAFLEPQPHLCLGVHRSHNATLHALYGKTDALELVEALLGKNNHCVPTAAESGTDLRVRIWREGERRSRRR